MLAYSHQVTSVGLVEGGAVLTHGIAMNSFSTGIALLVFADLGSLVPDVDQKDSLINYLLPVKLDNYFKHRGMTHSLIGFLIFAFCSYFLLKLFAPIEFANFELTSVRYCAWLGLVIGYFLHLVEDSFSQAGIRWLQPFSSYDKWAYEHYPTLLRPVNRWLELSNGKKLPIRHWWGRGYKVGGGAEDNFVLLMWFFIFIFSVWWMIRLVF